MPIYSLFISYRLARGALLQKERTIWIGPKCKLVCIENRNFCILICAWRHPNLFVNWADSNLRLPLINSFIVSSQTGLVSVLLSCYHAAQEQFCEWTCQCNKRSKVSFPTNKTKRKCLDFESSWRFLYYKYQTLIFVTQACWRLKNGSLNNWLLELRTDFSAFYCFVFVPSRQSSEKFYDGLKHFMEMEMNTLWYSRV